MQHLGTGDIRWQQVGRELDAAHLCVQMPSQGLDCTGLGQPWQAFQQQMTVGQQAQQYLTDHVLLAQDAFGHAGLQGG